MGRLFWFGLGVAGAAALAVTRNRGCEDCDGRAVPLDFEQLVGLNRTPLAFSCEAIEEPLPDERTDAQVIPFPAGESVQTEVTLDDSAPETVTSEDDVDGVVGSREFTGMGTLV